MARHGRSSGRISNRTGPHRVATGPVGDADVRRWLVRAREHDCFAAFGPPNYFGRFVAPETRREALNKRYFGRGEEHPLSRHGRPVDTGPRESATAKRWKIA